MIVTSIRICLINNSRKYFSPKTSNVFFTRAHHKLFHHAKLCNSFLKNKSIHQTTIVNISGTAQLKYNTTNETLKSNDSEYVWDSSSTTNEQWVDNTQEMASSFVDERWVDSVMEVTENIGSNISEIKAAGLASDYWPSSLIQWALDYLHTTMGLPWWGSIIVLTVIFRFATFPFWISSQRIAAENQRNQPKMQKLQYDFQQAIIEGNQEEVFKCRQNMMKGMSSQMAILKPVFFQAPFFIGMFFGIREMANYPIESMKSGGIFHFTDLTISDPLLILPCVTAGTMYIMISTNAEGSSDLQSMNPGMRNLMLYGLPILVLTTTSFFPSALVLYWATNNAIVLSQVTLLKIPGVRQLFKIPPKIDHPPSPYTLKSPLEMQMIINQKRREYEAKQKETNTENSRDIEDRKRKF